MSRIAALFVACLLALPGCSGEKRPPAEPAPVAPAPTPIVRAPASVPPAPSAPTDDPTPDDLPLPEDFAAEATQQITAKNFHAELDKIEKDLDAEK